MKGSHGDWQNLRLLTFCYLFESRKSPHLLSPQTPAEHFHAFLGAELPSSGIHVKHNENGHPTLRWWLNDPVRKNLMDSSKRGIIFPVFRLKSRTCFFCQKNTTTKGTSMVKSCLVSLGCRDSFAFGLNKTSRLMHPKKVDPPETPKNQSNEFMSS